MIGYDDALEMIFADSRALSYEIVSLADAIGRALCVDIHAPFDFPPFSNSAVDGFAIQLPANERLRLVGEMAAGDSPDKLKVGPGEAVRVLTGSPIPEGTNTVVQQEVVTAEGGWISIRDDVVPGANIRLKGEHIRTGARCMQSGMVINPASIGALASLGIREVSVVRRPRVAIVETGDELLDPGEELRDGKIYASNGYALYAAAESLGATIRTYRCRDD